jgi:hypothetical protein
MLDRIVGRCVRDPVFGEAVLVDPERALEEYELNTDELDDFRALAAEPNGARVVWAGIREAMERLAPTASQTLRFGPEA